MRLIGYINNEKHGKAFSNFLLKENIPNQCEINPNTDWGSPDYGNVVCKIWVYDEDQYEKALQQYNEFQKNPDDPRFYAPTPSLPFIADDKEPEVVVARTKSGAIIKNPNTLPMGILTFYLLIICGWIFVWGQMTEPSEESLHGLPNNLPYVPLLESPIYKTLIYDYPHAYEIVDQIIALHTEHNGELTPKAAAETKRLEAEFLRTPYWQGVYPYVVARAQGDTTSADYMSIKAPMFEKIRQGEVWRLFTPALLHANFLHILFNLIWLVVLGKQMEARLGFFRYALFIVVIGIISNTAQYIVSGSNFIGISGVIAGMFGFIWMRQKYAAWEGYQLQKGTIGFIMFFFGIMVAIQVVSFISEIVWKVTLSPGIANTAHIAGVIAGVIMGRMKYFAWNNIV